MNPVGGLPSHKPLRLSLASILHALATALVLGVENVIEYDVLDRQ